MENQDHAGAHAAIPWDIEADRMQAGSVWIQHQGQGEAPHCQSFDSEVMGDQLMDESIMWTSCKGSAHAWMVAPWERHEHSIPWWDTWVQLIGATCWLSLMGISSRMLIKINYQSNFIQWDYDPISFHPMRLSSFESEEGMACDPNHQPL